MPTPEYNTPGENWLFEKERVRRGAELFYNIGRLADLERNLFDMTADPRVDDPTLLKFKSSRRLFPVLGYEDAIDLFSYVVAVVQGKVNISQQKTDIITIPRMDQQGTEPYLMGALQKERDKAEDRIGELETELAELKDTIEQGGRLTTEHNETVGKLNEMVKNTREKTVRDVLRVLYESCTSSAAQELEEKLREI